MQMETSSVCFSVSGDICILVDKWILSAHLSFHSAVCEIVETLDVLQDVPPDLITHQVSRIVRNYSV